MATSRAAKVGLRDYVLDGLVPGIVGGSIMLLYLAIVGQADGSSFAEILSRFGAGTVSPIVGALSHFAVSAIYGALYGIAWALLADRLPWWGLGLLYGAALFALAAGIILPVSQSPVGERSMLQFGVSHGGYGLVLAWVYQRRQP